MLIWAVIALTLAILCGAFGYTGIVQGVAGAARILFGLFLLVATLLFVLLLADVDLTRHAAPV
jgi:uncharacterized membrane protein YtjA (UPF0391 family)